jgi:putative ABC transport system substrate-binding protein
VAGRGARATERARAADWDGCVPALRGLPALKAEPEKVHLVRLAYPAFLLVHLEPHAPLKEMTNRSHDALGLLAGLASDDPDMQARIAALRQGLESLGWSEGRNLRIDYRYAPASIPEQARAAAKELIDLRPDLIFAQSTPMILALQRESRTIPIVFVEASDPIGYGFVASLPRPGGHLTGFLLIEASITGKWLGMLKEIAPRLARAAIVGNPKTSPYDYFLQAGAAVAPSLAIEVMPMRVETAVDIESAIVSFAQTPNGGLVVRPAVTTTQNRNLIIALAKQYRLPAVYSGRFFVAPGGLMSYGPDRIDTWRQSAAYVDRILRGDKPADLPVQAPVKFETAVNLRTAQALGLTIPETLLATADEVIQ